MTFYVSCLCSIVDVHHADLEQGVFMWQKQGNRLPFDYTFMLVIKWWPYFTASSQSLRSRVLILATQNPKRVLRTTK
jgi:hypothetical protein